MSPIRQIVLIGLGAVGASYAGLIRKNLPDARLTAVTRTPRAYREEPVVVNGERLDIDLCAPGEAPRADLLIFAVKYYNLDEAIEQVRSCVGDDTIILSLLNGIDSEETIKRKMGRGQVLLSTAVGIDANRTGHEVRLNRMGEIYFGEEDNSRISPRVRRVEEFLQSAKIPYLIPSDMRRCLWWKLMINVGINQVSTVRQQTYGQVRRDPEALGLMERAQREVIAIAQKLGVALDGNSIGEWYEQLAKLHEDGRPSMLQDFWTGREMEIDAFGGYICRMGKELSVPTPVNAFLTERLREMQVKACS